MESAEKMRSLGSLAAINVTLFLSHRPICTLPMSDKCASEFIWSRPVHNMARFAVSEYNKDSTDLYASKLIKIISAKVEVNDDVKYILIVEIGRTQCLKMDNMDIDICPISNFDVSVESSTFRVKQFENMKPFYSWYIYSVCNYLRRL
uniref:Cystatin domain-containing protein n=1 Tax=Erpetoichthys calabaricus TaxID=27687 RepID=A0A8C4XC20_ERPCA